MKFVGISGDVNSPGVFEVPMGTKYSELIYQLAGGVLDNRKLLAYAPSGPSSGYLPASVVDLTLDWNAVAAAGSMVGSGCDRRRRRRPLHARHGAQCRALLPE